MQCSPNLTSLPPGQKAREDFPRFGLSPYAKRYQQDFGELKLTVGGECIDSEYELTSTELETIERRELQADFHCVTTWSKQNLIWSGYSFNEFFEKHIKKQLTFNPHWVVFKSIDGYRSRMLLQDLMNEQVLLADQLDHKPLCSSHGAPLRLVAPAHYGYKNPKYLKRIEFHSSDYNFKPPLLTFMEHPRARVALEERGQLFPGWFLRWLYRPMINSTVNLFKKTMQSSLD